MKVRGLWMKMTMVKYFKVIDQAMQLIGQQSGKQGFDLNSRTDFGNALIKVLAPEGYAGVVGWLAYYVLLYQHLMELASEWWEDDEDTQEEYLNSMVLCDWIFGDKLPLPRRSAGFSWLFIDIWLGVDWKGLELVAAGKLVDTIKVIDYSRFLGKQFMNYVGKVSFAYHLNQELENETGFCADDVVIDEVDEDEFPLRTIVLRDVVDEDNFLAFAGLLRQITDKLLAGDSPVDDDNW
jgi:hypothetical protein